MRSFLFLTCLLLLVQLLPAQLLFTTLKPADGLAGRETRAVFRDREGYVWVGTTVGLNRFDGAHFKLWNKTTPAYPNQLGEIITSIIEHKGKIYFGTNNGLGILNKTTGVIQSATINTLHTNRLVTRLVLDNKQRLWAATDKGLLIESGEQFVPASTIYPFARQLDSLYIYHGAFVFDSLRSCFWIGTYGGSFCLDLKNNTLLSAAHNPTANPFLTKNIILAVALDKEKNLWYSNATTATLCHYNIRTKALDSIARMNNNPDWNFSGGAPVLQFDREDRLWISTWTYTSYVRNVDGSFEQLTYNPHHPYSIGYGFFYDVFVDQYNTVWFATLNGLSKLVKNAFVQNIVQAPSYKYFLPVSFANINTVQPDGNDWWIGKMDGLFHYNGATKTFRRFVPSEKDFEANDIFDLKFVGDEVWCASNRGVQIFSKSKQTFRPLQHTADDKDYQSYTSFVQKDAEGNIWSCNWNKALCCFNPQTNTCRHFTVDSFVKQSRRLYQASDKKLWLATTNGVRILNPLTNSIATAAVPIKENINALAEDEQGNMWLATTSHGLVKCRADGVITDSITRANGLPQNWTGNVAVDTVGRLWITGREGLFCVSPATKSVSKVSVPVSYSFNDHWNSLLKKGVLLYASMLDQVVVINTSFYQMLPAAVPPLISSFSVFGTETPLTNDVELSYKQNFFSFDFASPFHNEVAAMQYAYKLQGFDKDWVYCGRNLTAAYTNVPDGNYTFLVRTTGADGGWMPQTTSVNIVIKPPFWKTWWFITLMAIGLAVLLYSLYNYRQKRRREKRMDDIVDYFANSLYGENSVNEICWDIARNCISQLKLEDCVVYLLDEKKNLLVQKAAFGPKNPKEHEIANPLTITPGEGIVGAAAASGKPILIGDTSKDSRYIIDDATRLSELAVPIVHEGKAIGVIDSEHSKKNFFSDVHVKVLSTIAAISANKIAEAKAEAAAQESQIQLLEIKKLLAESQLMALRAQMNPHFVFNCLNSIQECIVTQKYGEASLYLNKFAKLFRSVLNNSGKVFVTLAEEIEVLDLYLTLEHMRFEKSFTYKIDVDEELESEEILVPSMLLQPYVENALWHGLMHKQGDRRLAISFNKKNSDVFECVIDDNGIGRTKALELKEQQSKTKRHVSRGMSISKDRVELLQKQGQHATLTIIDKYDVDENPTGTKVVIELSAFLQ